MAENNEIPEDAEKILFAEDLINHVLCHTINIPFSATSAARYRAFVYNAFDENVMAAVSFLYNKLENENENIFYTIAEEDGVNIDAYAKYAENLRNSKFTAGFDAKNYLYFCVRLSDLAVYFYDQGVLEAPSLAVTYMVRALQNFDMTTGGWETLSRISENYATMEKDTVRELSPQSTSDEDVFSNAEQNLDTSNESKTSPNADRNCSLKGEKELEHQQEGAKKERNNSSGSSTGSISGFKLRSAKEFKKSSSTSSADTSPEADFSEKKLKDVSKSNSTCSPEIPKAAKKSVLSDQDASKRNVDLSLVEIDCRNTQKKHPTNGNESLYLKEPPILESINRPFQDENIPPSSDNENISQNEDS